MAAPDSDVRPTIRLGDPWALTLAGLLVVTGVAHLVAADTFDAIVPHVLPGAPAAWTLGSGIVELVLALGLVLPETRRLTATVTATFFVLVLPANIQMAVDWASRSALELTAALLRIPLQIPLIWWAWRVRGRSTSESAGASNPW
jgi:uncharacterized membrane protein